MDKPIAYSVLDLATVVHGGSPAASFRNSWALAQHVDKLGFTRYWFAEHHNMPSVASSAPAILVGHIAGATRNIRVGSGGVMLPNHATLVVAEQFGTLASLYPNRIDLGLGRAPGTDQLTAMAIRGRNFGAEHNFMADVQQLQELFSAGNSSSNLRAIPGEGLDIPIWILGSSMDSARVAAALGLPYAFASHFAPAYFTHAIALYRQHFQPSAVLDKPYVMACVNVVAAGTDKEAEQLATSLHQLFIGVISGKRQLLQPPVETMDGIWSPAEEAAVKQMLAYSFVGGPQKLQRLLKVFATETGVDEIMASSHIYSHEARLDSYSLFAAAMNGVNAG